MDRNTAKAEIERNHRSWIAALAPYRQASPLRSTVEIAVTALPFVCLWGLLALAVLNGHWWALLLTVPAADNVLRLLPPLNITDEEITEAVARLDRAAAQVETTHAG